MISKKHKKFLSTELYYNAEEMVVQIKEIERANNLTVSTDLIYDLFELFMSERFSCQSKPSADCTDTLIGLMDDVFIQHGYDLEGIGGNLFYDYMYTISCNFDSYYSSGIKGLLKGYSPGVGGPKIYLSAKLTSDAELDEMLNEVPGYKEKNEVLAYRGMGVDEYNSTTLGQFWSLAQGVAEECAEKYPIYYALDGVLISAKIKKDDMLYCDFKTWEEQEIIVKLGAVKRDGTHIKNTYPYKA